MSEFERKYKEKSDYKPEEPAIEYDANYLNTMRTKCLACYKSFFNEARSNVLIYATEHYAKVKDAYKRTIEKSFKLEIGDEYKIRLTANYIFKIINKKINAVLSLAPACLVAPYKSNDIHQVKDAELSHSVHKSILDSNNWNVLSGKIVRDYFVVGETVIYTYYDFDRGQIIDYEEISDDKIPEDYENEEKYIVEKVDGGVDPNTGMPIVGLKIKDKSKPIRGGEVVHERNNAYDVFIEEGVENWEDSAFVGIDKVVHKQTVRYMIQNDSNFTNEEKKKYLESLKGESKESIYNNKTFRLTDNPDLMILTYWFYRPSPEFPMGKIFIGTRNEIFWKLELQKNKDGEPIFPIDMAACIQFNGDPRGYSIIKVGRSPQSEINRCYSKVAETQITLGDDKIVTTFTEGLTEGEKLAGIRHLKLGKTAGDVTHIPGRSGEQYLAYLESNIKWIHSEMEEPYEDETKGGQADITATLYMSMTQKQKYVKHGKTISDLFCSLAKKGLELAKAYMPEEVVIQKVGTNEAINVAEFKKLGCMDYEIKVEPVTEDTDSMFSKYLVTRDALQYAQDLPPEQKGLIMKQFPWVNTDEMFGDTYIDKTEANNIVLALDRGEIPSISKYDNNEMVLKAMVRRMRRGDWKYVQEKDPEIVERYQVQYEQRTQIEQQKLQEIRDAEAGFIPTDGPLVGIDMYVNEKKADGNGVKVVKAKLPQNAIEWLMSKIGEQGAYLEMVEEFPKGTQADIMAS